MKKEQCLPEAAEETVQGEESANIWGVKETVYIMVVVGVNPTLHICQNSSNGTR